MKQDDFALVDIAIWDMYSLGQKKRYQLAISWTGGASITFGVFFDTKKAARSSLRKVRIQLREQGMEEQLGLLHTLLVRVNRRRLSQKECELLIL